MRWPARDVAPISRSDSLGSHRLILSIPTNQCRCSHCRGLMHLCLFHANRSMPLCLASASWAMEITGMYTPWSTRAVRPGSCSSSPWLWLPYRLVQCNVCVSIGPRTRGVYWCNAGESDRIDSSQIEANSITACGHRRMVDRNRTGLNHRLQFESSAQVALVWAVGNHKWSPSSITLFFFSSKFESPDFKVSENSGEKKYQYVVNYERQIFSVNYFVFWAQQRQIGQFS